MPFPYPPVVPVVGLVGMHLDLSSRSQDLDQERQRSAREVEGLQSQLSQTAQAAWQRLV